MLRFGTISKIDADKGLAKVSFKEDGIETDWLPVLQKNTISNKHFHMFDINEHVACMMDHNAEHGVIMGAVYSKNETPGTVKGADVEGVEFSDGTNVSYNRSTSELKIDCAGKVTVICTEATVEASSKVTLDTPTVDVSGDLNVSGGITAGGDMEATGNIKTTAGDITTNSGEVKAGTIPLKTHKHTGVQPGGGTSATPIP